MLNISHKQNILLVDSHCHLQYEPLVSDLTNLTKSLDGAVSKMICIATSLECTRVINDIIKTFSSAQNTKPDLYSSVGIHPLHIASNLKSIELIKKGLIENLQIAYNVVAIGESGLDDFRTPLSTIQLDAFEAHIQVGIEYDLPIVMHTRCGKDSRVEEETIKLLDKYPDAKIIAHCYGGSIHFMQYLVQRKSLISFACNIGYKNSHHLREVAALVPIDNIMIETDSPFLSPEDKRRMPNNPSNVVHVATTLSQIYGMEFSIFADHIHKNFDNFFTKTINQFSVQPNPTTNFHQQ